MRPVSSSATPRTLPGHHQYCAHAQRKPRKTCRLRVGLRAVDAHRNDLARVWWRVRHDVDRPRCCSVLPLARALVLVADAVAFDHRDRGGGSGVLIPNRGHPEQDAQRSAGDRNATANIVAATRVWLASLCAAVIAHWTDRPVGPSGGGLNLPSRKARARVDGVSRSGFWAAERPRRGSRSRFLHR